MTDRSNQEDMYDSHNKVYIPGMSKNLKKQFRSTKISDQSLITLFISSDLKNRKTFSTFLANFDSPKFFRLSQQYIDDEELRTDLLKHITEMFDNSALSFSKQIMNKDLYSEMINRMLPSSTIDMIYLFCVFMVILCMFISFFESIFFIILAFVISIFIILFILFILYMNDKINNFENYIRATKYSTKICPTIYKKLTRRNREEIRNYISTGKYNIFLFSEKMSEKLNSDEEFSTLPIYSKEDWKNLIGRNKQKKREKIIIVEDEDQESEESENTDEES